jgi:RNA polymerase sigma-70 factor (ECF subfamily)
VTFGPGHERNEPDDATLWSRSRAGDSGAFGLLFERHAKAIYNYCFRRTGDWALAEDLLSVVFLEAWRRRRKELEPGMVLPWLYGIATNVLRNQWRSQRRYAAALRRVPRPRDEPGFAEGADARVDDERRMREVLATVAKLPRREQDVFALCAWAGLSYEEAATALGVPVGTVRSRLSRARARLKELELDPDFGHEGSEAP